MDNPIRVEIQGGTNRRRLVLAALIEHWPADLVDLSEEKKAVSDAEIEQFLRTMTPDERNKCFFKYNSVFQSNANAALRRLHPVRPTQYGRVTTNVSPIENHEVPRGVKPGGRDKQ